MIAAVVGFLEEVHVVGKNWEAALATFEGGPPSHDGQEPEREQALPSPCILEPRCDLRQLAFGVGAKAVYMWGYVLTVVVSSAAVASGLGWRVDDGFDLVDV